jgi:hypothetical protein
VIRPSTSAPVGFLVYLWANSVTNGDVVSDHPSPINRQNSATNQTGRSTHEGYDEFQGSSARDDGSSVECPDEGSRSHTWSSTRSRFDHADRPKRDRKMRLRYPRTVACEPLVAIVRPRKSAPCRGVGARVDSSNASKGVERYDTQVRRCENRPSTTIESGSTAYGRGRQDGEKPT